MRPLTTVPIWRFLGEPSIPWQGRDLTDQLGKKAIGLIAYLSLARDGAGRDEVAALLWPPSEPSDLARSKHNLRQCLVAMRKAFGDGFDQIFHVTDRWMTLTPSDFAVDVQQLRQLEANPHFSPEALLELCRGPFLRSLATRAHAFDDWAEGQRTQLTQLAGRLLDVANETAERAGDRELAARLAAAMTELGYERAVSSMVAVPVEATPVAPPRRRWTHRTMFTLVAVAVLLGAVPAINADIRDRAGDILVKIGEKLGVIAPSVPSLSVLPFVPVNGLPEEAALAGGVTFGVNYSLYSVSELKIVTPARPTVELDKPQLVKRAAQLGVRYLIWGKLEIKDGRVWVHVECLDAKLGEPVWKDSFHQDIGVPSETQEKITLRILKGLNIDLSTAERNRLQYLADTDDLEAWLAAANGVAHLIRVSRADVGIAKASYSKALSRDPGYISAHRGLAWVHFLNVRLGWSADPFSSIQEAKSHLEASIKAQPDNGTNLSLSGAVKLLERKYDEAISDGRKAVERLPGSADAWAVFAHTLTYVGQHDEALKAIDRAMALSERDPTWYLWTLGRALRMAGEFEDSVKTLEKDRNSSDPQIVHLVELTASYVAAGELKKAQEVAAEIQNLRRGQFDAKDWLSHPPISIPEIQAQELKYLTDAGL